MIKSVRVGSLAPSKKELVYGELADVIHKSVSISANFHSKFKRNPRQQELHELLQNSEHICYDEDEDEITPLVVLCYGTTGSGKSEGTFAEILNLMFEHPGMKGLFARHTYVEIEDSIWPASKAFLDKYEVPYHARKGSYEIELGNRSEIRMRSAMPASQSKSNKVHGLGSTEYAVAFLEEADEITEEFLYTVFARMRQKVKGLRFPVIFLVCNPPSEQHWIYDFFFNDPDNNPYDPKSWKRVLKFEQGDNTANVRKGYEKGLKKLLKDDPMLYDAFVKGDFSPDRKGNPIFYQAFSKDIHVAKVPIHKSWDPDKPIFVSVDFGFNSPALLCGQDYPELNQIRCYESWTGKKVLLRPFVTRCMNHIREMFPGARFEFFCDPHGADSDNQGRTAETAVDILRDMGYPPRYLRLSTERGLDLVMKAMMHQYPTKHGPQPGILIDPQCDLLIKALSIGYCNDKNAPKGKIQPVKDGVHDHQVDVLRYVTIIKRRNSSRGEQVNQATDNGTWRTVADGPQESWAAQLQYTMENGIYAPVNSRGRRISDRISPNFNKESLW